MFDVGFTEILLIGIVALVVIGPERLPAVAKTAGQWIGKLQRFVTGVKTDLASELEAGDLKKLIGDQREQINELKKIVTTAKDDFQSSTKDAVDDARKSLSELETTVNETDEKVDETTQAQQPGVDASTLGSGESETPGIPDTATSRQSVSAQKFPSAESESAKKPDDSSNMDRTGTESGS